MNNDKCLIESYNANNYIIPYYVQYYFCLVLVYIWYYFKNGASSTWITEPFYYYFYLVTLEGEILGNSFPVEDKILVVVMRSDS